jgi:hypothetical protein
MEGKKKKTKKSWKILNIILPKISTIFLPSAKNNHIQNIIIIILFLTPKCCPKATMSQKKTILTPRCWISDLNMG